MLWTKKGFEEFSKGTMGNGGQNLYVSAKGILQRIFNFDVNGDGYVDLPLSNSHSMNERPKIQIYDSFSQEKPLELPSNGSFDAIFTDLTGDGTEDLVVACQHNGVHTDVTAIIYFGSEMGLSEKYKTELCVPNSLGVVAGDFDGRGKNSLAFISKDKLRIFYNGDLGIESGVFTELDVSALSIACGDFDGDGFDDIYVMRQNSGDLEIYWGGEDGITPERKTVLAKGNLSEENGATSTTAGRRPLRSMPWRVSALKLRDKTITFRADGDDAVFESFSKDRVAKEAFRIHVENVIPNESTDNALHFTGCGPMHATCGDLRGDGSVDIAIAVASDFDRVYDLIVLWEKDGYAYEKATLLPVRAARYLSIGPVDQSGKNYLFVTQASEINTLDFETEIYSFDEDKTPQKRLIEVHDPACVLSGRTYTDGRYQIAVVNHEGEQMLGFTSVSIFLGGEDGYNGERRINLPGRAATDTIMCDFNDDGLPDVLVVNCAENAPSLTPGSLIYYNSPDGFDVEGNCVALNSDLSHGAAIGDFRKSGYLDIIMGGIFSRILKVFEGGPDGYDFDNPKLLVMGPEPEKCTGDLETKSFEGRLRLVSEEELEYSDVRWMFAADFNGDGYLDLFVSMIHGKRSFIFWGGPDGFKNENMQELATEGVGYASAADLNGNGYLDLVCGRHLLSKHTFPQEKGGVVIYWGGPDGYKENRKSELPSFCCNSLTIQDFNNDGNLDIFATAYANGRRRDIDARIYFGAEDGIFHLENRQSIPNHSGCGCLAGDFNGDGYVDLFVANHKAHGNHVNDSYVFWGGEDGINEKRYTKLPGIGPHGTCSVDIGNIMDRTDSEYYYSEIFRVPDGEIPSKASWVAENGKKTWVKMQIRCAETPDGLANAQWIGTRPDGKIENGDSIKELDLRGYIQYKLELGAACGCGTPRVSEITVEFDKK